jgi:hypothetical protein
MMTDLYMIQLHGGPFDGYHQSVYYILLDSCLKMPGTLPCPDGLPLPSQPAMYELKQSFIEKLDGLPTMILNYHFVGMQVGMLSATIARLIQLKNRLTNSIVKLIGGQNDIRLPNKVQADDPNQPNSQLVGKHSD